MSDKVLNETENKFVLYVNEALDAVKMTKDPEELNRYRRLFKKCVPLTMRSYVAAYLAKQAISSNTTPETSFQSGKVQKDIKTTHQVPHQTSHTSKPKIVLNEDEAKVLFFSVGRKRGVTPKDIITVIMQNVELPREHIGEIKLLDNYCFVQIMNESSEAVISHLNNTRYRGRSLSVSYATQKERVEEKIEELNSDSTVESSPSDVTNSGERLI